MLRKWTIWAKRRLHQTLAEVRRTRRAANRHADPVVKADLRTDLAGKEPNPDDLPPVMGSFPPNALKNRVPIDASKFTIGKPPIAPGNDPKAPRYTP